ncbi:homocysteine S-methyltransferase [Paraferrimonas sedimenticola]|uniref:Homocysteine S-methyltransferase YbgG n=1 Tax=Paraferrimonas sedimenticola TaxID=375674 RepID=A0AA37W0K2_9GAMM|nr:homocysteine S-methyltransferase [Paraferrimonas sedimenticola]GLP95488.1 homocysteine S-methyltransferase YbgG [Paraferrimonas sedimenticola]
MTLFAQGPVVLDGGLATQLEAQGHNLNHSLWSAKLLLSEPQAIVDAHLAYLQAGANCIISASYQASLDGFLNMGLAESEARDAMALSGVLARQALALAREQVDQPVFLAHSVGPYGAILANGSEYHGLYGVSDQTLFDFHSHRLPLLAAKPNELLACETIPCLQEARVLARVLEQQHNPAWVSFACQDEARLNDGSPIEAAIELYGKHAKVVALGINCTPIQHVSGLIARIARVTDKPILVYPNSGECFDACTKTWHTPNPSPKLAELALEWQQLGAVAIGGCCRVGPEQIAELAAKLER